MPWNQFSDEDKLDLIMKVNGNPARYAGTVLSGAGIKYGLAVYPGGKVPALEEVQPGERPELPPKSHMLYLDEPAEIPDEDVARAHRYGWPEDAKLFPLFFTFRRNGLADIGQTDAAQLTTALAAVAVHVTAGTRRTKGKIDLPHGGRATFTVTTSA